MSWLGHIGAAIVLFFGFVGGIFGHTPVPATVPVATPNAIVTTASPVSSATPDTVTSAFSASTTTIIRAAQPQNCSLYKTGTELYNECFTNQAVQKVDPSLCALIQQNFDAGWIYKDSCYKRVAIAANKASICEMIHQKSLSAGFYYSCVATINKDPAVCDSFNNNSAITRDKDKCLTQVAVAQKDASLCKPMTLSDYTGDRDSDECFMQVGIAQADAQTCSPVQSSWLKQTCLSQVSVKHADLTACIQSGDTGCIMQIPVNSKSDCQNLTGNTKDLCLAQFAITTKNVSACENIITLFTKDSCYTGLAHVLKDMTLCTKAQADYNRSLCYDDVEGVITDPAQCELIPKSEPYQPDNCYANYAEVNLIPSLCTKITTKEFRDQCIALTKTAKDSATTGVVATTTPVTIGWIWDSPPGSPDFGSLIMPDIGNPNPYHIYIWNGSSYDFYQDVAAGVTLMFPTGGVSRFKILGVDPELGIDPSGHNVIFGLGFSATGTFDGTRETIIKNVPI